MYSGLQSTKLQVDFDHTFLGTKINIISISFQENRNSEPTSRLHRIQILLQFDTHIQTLNPLSQEPIIQWAQVERFLPSWKVVFSGRFAEFEIFPFLFDTAFADNEPENNSVWANQVLGFIKHCRGCYRMNIRRLAPDADVSPVAQELVKYPV